MRGVICPHEKWSCGRNSPDVVVGMNQSETIEVGRYLGKDEICHYSFKANELITDPMSYKRVSLYFEDYKGMDIHVAMAKDMLSIKNST